MPSLEARVQLTPANDLVEEIAREKTPEDLALMSEVGVIADVGAMAMVEHARPGVSEFELVAQMEYAMRLAGADDNFHPDEHAGRTTAKCMSRPNACSSRATS